jgi:tRNA A37 N6-isopentenylltransferase MiaA
VLKAQFKTARVTTNTTKFAPLAGSFEGQYLEQVEAIVINLPSMRRYEKLNSELFRRVTDSDGRRVQKMLECEEMGGRTLKEISSTPDDFVLTLWSSRLSTHVQHVRLGRHSS